MVAAFFTWKFNIRSTFILYFVPSRSSISICTQSWMHHRLPHPSFIFFLLLYILLCTPRYFSPYLVIYFFLPFSFHFHLFSSCSVIPPVLRTYSSFFPSPSFPHFSVFPFPSRFSHPYLLPLLFSPFTISFFLPFFLVIKHSSFCYVTVNLSFPQHWRFKL